MKNTTDDPLTELANAAFRQAAQNVIKRAIEAGTPLIIWEDEQIKRVKPRKQRKNKKAES
jgi:hypothetical protein